MQPIPKGNLKDIQAYLDYYAIVGDDDNGKMMSESEFEAYKKRSPQQELTIYTSITQTPKVKNAKR